MQGRASHLFIQTMPACVLEVIIFPLVVFSPRLKCWLAVSFKPSSHVLLEGKKQFLQHQHSLVKMTSRSSRQRDGMSTLLQRFQVDELTCPPHSVPDQNEEKDSSYDARKRKHSAATKKRLAENNAHYANLQKQLGQELKAMIPEEFMEQAKNDAGSNRDLIHTLNGTKLYIASLTNENTRLQPKTEGMLVDTDDHKFNDVSLAERTLGSQTRPRVGIEPPATSQVLPRASGVAGFAGVGLGHGGGAVAAMPKSRDEDGPPPEIPIHDISPHDYYLRQAVEKLITVTKARVMGSQGVLSEEQIVRLNTVHDLMVDMIEETRKK